MTLDQLARLQQRLNRLNRDMRSLEQALQEELSTSRPPCGVAEGNTSRDGAVIPSTLMFTAEPLRDVLLVLQRLGQATAGQIADGLGLEPATVESQLLTLVQGGQVGRLEHAGQTLYDIRLGAKRAARLPGDIWLALEHRLNAQVEPL